MQSTGQMDTQASQPVHISSSSSASCLGNFLAIAGILGWYRICLQLLPPSGVAGQQVPTRSQAIPCFGHFKAIPFISYLWLGSGLFILGSLSQIPGTSTLICKHLKISKPPVSSTFEIQDLDVAGPYPQHLSSQIKRPAFNAHLW